MNPLLGVGLSLLVVAGVHLFPAIALDYIPTTTSRRIRRHEDAKEFTVTFWVFFATAVVGAGLTLGGLALMLMAL